MSAVSVVIRTHRARCVGGVVQAVSVCQVAGWLGAAVVVTAWVLLGLVIRVPLVSAAPCPDVGSTGRTSPASPSSRSACNRRVAQVHGNGQVHGIGLRQRGDRTGVAERRASDEEV
jgi:hypothetical protein